MQGRDRPRVPCIDRAEKRKRLSSAKFAKKDPVWSHSKRCLQQILGIHFCFPAISPGRDQADRVCVDKPDFRGVFDEDQSLGGIDLLD